MSRQADEASERKTPKKSNNSSEGLGRLVNYQPTVEIKKFLKEGGLPITRAMSILERVEMSGHRLSSGCSVDKGGFFVIVREGTPDWKEARSVSFWTSSLERSFILAAYYLSEVNPDFPSLDFQLSFTDDW